MSKYRKLSQSDRLFFSSLPKDGVICIVAMKVCRCISCPLLRYLDSEDWVFKSCYFGYFHCTKENIPGNTIKHPIFSVRIPLWINNSCQFILYHVVLFTGCNATCNSGTTKMADWNVASKQQKNRTDRNLESIVYLLVYNYSFSDFSSTIFKSSSLECTPTTLSGRWAIFHTWLFLVSNTRCTFETVLKRTIAL